MKNKPLTENFSDLNNILKSYLEARLNLWKVHLLEKVTKIGTYLLSLVIILVTLLFVFIFLTFAFSYWYGDAYGSIWEGFLLSAGFYILLAIVAYLLRKRLFSNNIVRNIAIIIFNDDDKD